MQNRIWLIKLYYSSEWSCFALLSFIKPKHSLMHGPRAYATVSDCSYFKRFGSLMLSLVPNICDTWCPWCHFLFYRHFCHSSARRLRIRVSQVFVTRRRLCSTWAAGWVLLMTILQEPCTLIGLPRLVQTVAFIIWCLNGNMLVILCMHFILLPEWFYMYIPAYVLSQAWLNKTVETFITQSSILRYYIQHSSDWSRT